MSKVIGRTLAWCCGDQYILLHKDGAWSQVDVTGSSAIMTHCCAITSADNIYVVAWASGYPYGTLYGYRSTDGGDTWTEWTLPTAAQVYDMEVSPGGAVGVVMGYFDTSTKTRHYEYLNGWGILNAWPEPPADPNKYGYGTSMAYGTAGAYCLNNPNGGEAYDLGLDEHPTDLPDDPAPGSQPYLWISVYPKPLGRDYIAAVNQNGYVCHWLEGSGTNDVYQPPDFSVANTIPKISRSKNIWISDTGKVYVVGEKSSTNRLVIHVYDGISSWTETVIDAAHTYSKGGAIVGYDDDNIDVFYIYTSGTSDVFAQAHWDGSIWTLSDLRTAGSSAAHVGAAASYYTVTYSPQNNPVTTYDIQSAKQANAAFYFVHIEGFPYLWTTDYDISSGWTPPTGFTLRPGLMLTPHDEAASFVISKQMDVFSGVEDADSIDITICDTLLHTLFATRKPMDTSNAAELVTNNIAAGSDANIEVGSEITGAPASDGTIYIGNQTITYSTKSGTTFSGINRGRYAILDDNLDEVTWKPYLEWDEVLNIPLMVTTFPQRISGRVMTIYRCYRHPDTKAPLAKAESQIRFRGKITAYGMQSTPNGYDIHANSIIAELEQDIMARSAECSLQGYALVNAALDEQQKYSEQYIEIVIREEWWDLDDADAVPAVAPLAKAVFGAFPMVDKIIQVQTSQYYFDTPDELIAAINAELSTQYAAGYLKAPWFCKRGQDGHVQFGHHCIGYSVEYDMDGATVNPSIYEHTIVPIAVGNTQVYNWTDSQHQYRLCCGIKGSVKANIPLSALGFGEADGKFISVGTDDPNAYANNFALYTNPTHTEYDDYLTGVSYEPQQILAEDEVAQAWFRLDYATRIPTNVTSDDGFVETIGDESPFLVKVGNKIVYRAATIEYVSQDVMLVDANYDFNNPIAGFTPPEDKYISVPESARGEDVPKVRQVFMPSGLHEVTADIIWNGETTTIAQRQYGVCFTILQLMASTGTTDYNGDFDVLPRGWGLGIPEQYIDVASFQNLYDQYPWEALQRRWIFDRPMSFRDFIEAEAKTLGFIVMVSEGKITAVPSEKLATNGSAVATIDNTMRVIDSEIGWRTAPEGIRNLIKISFEYDYIEEKFYSVSEFHDMASQIDSRMVSPIEIGNKGLVSSFRTSPGVDSLALTAVQTMMQDRLAAYSKEVYDYTCQITRKGDGLKVGDIVYVTDSRLPNHLDGTVGISWHLGRIVRYEFDELQGRGEVTVRLNYEFNREIKVFTDVTFWNVAQFSPSAQIESWVADNQAIINTTLHNPDGFSDAQRILITDMTTGDQWSAGIESIDLTTGAVVFDTSLADARASSSELIMDFASFDDISSSSVDGDEFYSAIIGERFLLG